MHISFEHLGCFGFESEINYVSVKTVNDANKWTRKLRSIAISQLVLPLRCDIQIGVDFSTNSLTES